MNFKPVDGWIRPTSGTPADLVVGTAVEQVGVDHGGAGVVLAINKGTLVVKWPAHKYWSGIGSPWQYASPTIAVYSMEDGSINNPKCTGIIEWDVTRKKAAK